MNGRLKNIAAKVRENSARITYFSLVVLFLGFCLLDKSMHRNVMYAAFPFWVMTLMAAEGKKHLLANTLVKSMAVLYIFANVSILWSSPLDIEEGFVIVKSTVFGFAFVLILMMLPRQTDIERLIRYYVVGAVAAVVIAVFENYVPNGFSVSRLTLAGRGANPNVAGFLIGWALIAYVSLAGRPIFKQRWWVLVVPILSIGLLATTSRSSILATISALIVIACFARNTRRTLALALMALGIILLASGLALYADYDQVFTRSDSDRIEIFMLTLDMIKQHPVFGAGMGSAYQLTIADGSSYTGAHNILLGTLYQLGIVGLVLFLVPFYLLLRYAFEASRREGRFLPLSALIFGIVAGTFDLHSVFVNLNHEWLVWLLPAGMLLRDDSSERPNEPQFC